MTIDLTTPANLAELFGAVTVIISLSFVAIQLRDGARSARAEAAIAAIGATADWYRSVSENEQRSTLYFQFLREPDALS